MNALKLLKIYYKLWITSKISNIYTLFLNNADILQYNYQLYFKILYLIDKLKLLIT